MGFAFTKSDRILKRNEFVELSKIGKRLQNRYFIANFVVSRRDRCRLGVTVTKKVGGAVKRNRIKRLVREYFRLNRQSLTGFWDINIIAKKESADLSSEKAFAALQNIFERISSCVDQK